MGILQRLFTTTRANETNDDGPVAFGNLSQLAEDLTHLEINTIVKQDLTARKMPPPPLAVLEVAETYRRWLEQQLVALDADIRLPAPLDDPSFLTEQREALRLALAEEQPLNQAKMHQAGQLFQQLYSVARELTATPTLMEQLRQDGRDALALRIIDSALVLRRMILHYCGEADGHPWDGQIRRRDRIMLRKIWEVGVQRVKMQTVIQLDGDVITYVQEALIREDHDAIQQIHNQSVGIAINSWRFLVETLGQMLKQLAKPGT